MVNLSCISTLATACLAAPAAVIVFLNHLYGTTGLEAYDRNLFKQLSMKPAGVQRPAQQGRWAPAL